MLMTSPHRWFLLRAGLRRAVASVGSLGRLVGFTTLVITAATVVGAEAKRFTPEQLTFFENRVRPLLAEHCQACHGVETQESGLRLDSRAAALAGGDLGPAVIPSAPEGSPLIEAIRYEGLEMPPDHQLDPEAVAVLTRWVAWNAPWPNETAAVALGDQEHIWRAAAEHWAFQPLRSPPVPSVDQGDGVKNPIDAFVMRQLEAHDLRPASPADRRTLIRRLSFDLIGLPPSPAEVEAFVNDPSPDAYAELVDRLLESPRYGEHWGRRWLDIARYADSRDWFPQVDTSYPYAYTYRDWVVGALNDDMPYARFLRYQIAADQYVDAADDP